MLMNTLTQTRRIARPLSYLTTAALLAYPFAMLLMALSGYFNETYLRDAYDMVAFPDTLSTPAWVTIYVVATGSIALTCAVLWNMRALLVLYATGDVLGAEAALRIRRIGNLLLALAIYGVVAHTLTVLALTWGNSPGERSLSIAFNNTDLFLFLAAGLMTVIGLAMAEAARIADENRAFV